MVSSYYTCLEICKEKQSKTSYTKNNILSTGEPAIRSRYARLLVLMPPDPPKILQGPVLQAVEDREVDLECVSVGGKPAAEVNKDSVLTCKQTALHYYLEVVISNRSYLYFSLRSYI